MRESDFAFAVGRTWVIETRLVDAGKFDRMLDAKDVEEVFRILGETEYSGALANVKSPDDFEAVLEFERRRVFKLVRNLLQAGEEIGSVYFHRFDIHNLKVLLKAEMAGQRPDGLVDEGVFGPEPIKKFVLGLEAAPEPLASWISIGREAQSAKDPQTVDLALDGAYFNYAAGVSQKRSWGAVTRYWTASIDLSNLLTTIRCRRLGIGAELLKRALIGGGTLSEDKLIDQLGASDEEILAWLRDSGYGDFVQPGSNALNSVTALERTVRQYLFGILARASRDVVVGPEPIFAYLLAKELEIQKLRIILVGKLNGVSREALRERLHHVHV